MTTLKKGDYIIVSNDGKKWEKRIFHHLTKSKGYMRPRKYAVLKKQYQYLIESNIITNKTTINELQGSKSECDYFTNYKPVDQQNYNFEKKDGEKLLKPAKNDEINFEIFDIKADIHNLSKSMKLLEKERHENRVNCYTDYIEFNSYKKNQDNRILTIESEIESIKKQSKQKTKQTKKNVNIDSFVNNIGYMAIGAGIMFIVLISILKIKS